MNKGTNKSKRKNKYKKKSIKDVLLTSIFSVLIYILIGILLIFGSELYLLDVLPEIYFGILVGIIILLGLMIVLFYLFRKKMAASVMLIIMIGIFGMGIYFLRMSKDVLEDITEKTISTDVISVYVKSGDTAEGIQNIRDYSVGILNGVDRENTDAALKGIEQEINGKLKIQEYENVEELVDGIDKNEIQAILVRDVYLKMLKDFRIDNDDEEESNFMEDLRVIWIKEIERKLVINQESLEKEDKNQEEIDAKVETDITNTPFIVYLSGNDYDGQLRANGRSDVNILVAVNPITNKILLVNTPRDFYVNLPKFDKKDKLTHAGIYGIDESMKVLSNLYDISVNNYVRLNFSGFMDAINAIGGITVYSDVEFTVAEWHYVVGANKLNGIEALAFARERYSFQDGDRQRGKNQQAVIKAVIAKICSPQILTKYSELMNCSKDMIETNMSTEDLVSLVKKQLETGKKWEIESVSAEGSDGNEKCYSIGNNAYVMVPNDESINMVKEQIREFMEVPASED